MAKLPYPPAPELGWYSDDPVEGTPDSAVGTAEPQNDYGQPSTAEAATNTAFTAEPAATAAAAEPAATAPADTTPHAAENDIEDWDSTVLSSSFTSKAPKKTYLLHNDVTGQTIVIDKSTLLGRKPSMDVPQGAKAGAYRRRDPHHIPQPCRHQHRHRWRAVDRGLRLVERHLHHHQWPRDTSHQGHTAQAQRACHGAYRRPVLPVHRKTGLSNQATSGCLLLFNRKITMANIRMARN